MKDYRDLSEWHQKRIDNKIREEIEPGHFKNKNNNFEWTEPAYTLHQVRTGQYCADCLMVWYNCLCSHD